MEHLEQASLRHRLPGRQRTSDDRQRHQLVPSQMHKPGKVCLQARTVTRGLRSFDPDRAAEVHDRTARTVVDGHLRLPHLPKRPPPARRPAPATAPPLFQVLFPLAGATAYDGFTGSQRTVTFPLFGFLWTFQEYPFGMASIAP